MVPILFTLTPCGSIKTLDFMKWLGISIPKWLENDLKHSEDILEKSLRLSKEVFQDILEFSREKNIPIGCNIESLSTRKVEIDASIQLVKDIREIFK
jgi:5,10-methylenetetrahydrofolate reductase